MATLLEVPSRFAPATSMASAVSRSRMPPLALTPKSGPTVLRKSFTSSMVAPVLEKPVEVFTKMNAGIEGEFAGADFFFVCQQAGFQNRFYGAFLGGFGDVAQFAQDVAVVAVLEAANVDDEIDFLGAGIEGGFDFKALDIGFHCAERESDDAGGFDCAAFQ